jgi:prophage antirepressor-like protein
MENSLTVFTNEQFGEIRTIMINGEPWFVLRDICALGIGNTSDVKARLDDDEKGIDSVDTPGGKQEMSVVSESGLYKIIFQSRKKRT